MKTMYQFIKNRQFFKITLERDYQEECVTVHTRYQVYEDFEEAQPLLTPR